MEAAQFGPYRIEETLDRTGVGEVHRAVDTGTDRVVALTVLSAELSADPAYGERFRLAAERAAALAEPHLVPVHRHGEVDGRLFLDAALVPGRDLAAVLAADGPMAPARALAVVGGAARALDAAHAAGLVHGDVRSAKVVLTADDDVRLVGLGVPRPGPDADAPDPRTDVRALAAVLAECLTGRRPDDASTPTPPGRLDDVVRRGLAAEPGAGYATCGELAAAATAALADPAGTPPPPEGPAGATRLDAGSSPAAGRRGLLPLVLAGIAVLAALAVVLGVVLSGGSDDDGQADPGPATAQPVTTTPSAPPEDEAEDRLRAIIPLGFVSVECDTGEATGDGALAVLGCGSSVGQPGPEDSAFYLYEDPATAEAVFLDDMERNGVAPLPDGAACPEAQGHGTYEDDGRTGRLACYIDADNDAIMAWTQDDVGAQAWVVVIDGGQPGLDALYAWWAFPEFETKAFEPR